MSVWQTFRVAARALLRNGMRSFLTTLGIVIGVGAVIAMVAIGEGAKARVEQAFARMGSNLLVVLPGSTTSGGARGGFGSRPTLTYGDLAAIRREAPAVRYAAPRMHSVAQVMTEDQNWTTEITGTTPDYLLIRDWPTALGHPFTTSDVDGGTKVCLLGKTVVDQLFGPGVDPVGSMVRIGNIPFQVIGVLATKGQSAWGHDYDDAVMVPVTTYEQKIQGGLSGYIHGVIFVSAISGDATAAAEAQIRAILRDRHHLRANETDDFSVRNLAEMASARQQGTETMTLLLAAIAAVSLLVGGIGIMNIMLVSVTERTREIGLRMAVGAKTYHILGQFLMEALTLSVAGGLIGVGLGVFAANRLAASFGWPMLIRPGIVVVAVAFSAVVGIGFGLYPARKASRLDPIEALRFE